MAISCLQYQSCSHGSVINCRLIKDKMNSEKYEKKKKILSHFWSDVFHPANHVEIAMLRHEANSNRQEVTGNLTDSLSRVGLRKDLAAQNWNMLCFSSLILPKRRLRAESSLQRLCALICADKAGAWARKKVERDSEAEAATRHEQPVHLHGLLERDRAFIDSL